MTGFSKQAALDRLNNNSLLQSIMTASPPVKAIIDLAVAQQNSPGYDRIEVYTRLKRQARDLVGIYAQNPDYRTAAHYDAVVLTVADLLPPDETDLTSDYA